MAVTNFKNCILTLEKRFKFQSLNKVSVVFNSKAVEKAARRSIQKAEKGKVAPTKAMKRSSRGLVTRPRQKDLFSICLNVSLICVKAGFHINFLSKICVFHET